MCKLLLDVLAAAIDYVFHVRGILQMTFSPFSEMQGLKMHYTKNDYYIR